MGLGSVLEELGKKFKARTINFCTLVVTLDNHLEIRSGQSISCYYSALVSIVDKKFTDLPLNELLFMIIIIIIKISSTEGAY